jgi:two-component system, cell cycle response regulator DivK
MTRRILIIEDNALVREMYRSALKPLNADLIETQRGAHAAEIAKREQPDLIILDFLLPDIPGEDVAKQLKAEPETANIPIVAVTNKASAGDEASLKTQGIAALIAKPINLTTFCQTVARLLPK